MARRKGRRFTPALVSKFVRERARGGVYADHNAFHQVSRADPASISPSSIVPRADGLGVWDLLSGAESQALGCALMEEDLDEIRSQYRLSRTIHGGDLAPYGEPTEQASYLGTVELALKMGHRHPELKKNGAVEIWPLTTDLVLTTRVAGSRRKLCGISVKADEYRRLPRSQKTSLMIERSYWLEQDQDWILITPESYVPGYAEAILRYQQWVINAPRIQRGDLEKTASLICGGDFSLSTAIVSIEAEFHCARMLAQARFWQSVWAGMLTIDITRTIWHSAHLVHISREQFREMNPVLGRRCGWKA